MIEMHCHSTYSDGSETIKDIMKRAKETGVSKLALTDHDATNGLAVGHKEAENQGIEFVSGIELSCFDEKRGRKVHLLGYFIEQDNEALEEFCNPIRKARQQANLQSIEKLIRAGFPITLDEVIKYVPSHSTGIYKQHIMQVLINKGYATDFFGKTYKEYFSSEEGIAYTSVKYGNPFEAVEAISQAGGAAVLAHPGQYNSFEITRELVEKGLHGIEIYHPLHSKKDREKARQLEEEYRLVPTGGSDFHGKYGEQEVELGSYEPDNDSFEELNRRLK